ncbi:BQ5605_C003g02208 [Microbotryum silenes-dioicae]|uniref:BQ5605_C003g02208 protein n=1 Tax=Microbotryum silenes-dioicae TaxID=796604 RepID=A0A2X0M0Z4_9BASI|nr:BQ5605_C003g02208 [Microbotryum silenes-dioicae]
MAHRPGRGHRHSTWTRRHRQSHTTIYFDQARVHPAHRQLLCEGVRIGQSSRRLGYGQRVDPAPLPPARPGPTHPQPSYVEHGNGDAYLRFRHQHGRSWTARPYSPARSIRPRCLSVTHYFFLQGKMASTPTFLFAGSTKPGRQSPETESRSTMVSNCARYLPVLVWMTKTNRRTKTATMRMKTARKGTKRMVMVNDDHQGDEEYLAYYLHERGDYFSIPHATQRLLLEFLTDGYSQVETDRLNYIRFHQENLRLTTAQGITDAVANGLTPDQIGRSVILGSTFKNSPREVTQRYQDAMACVVKYGKPSLFITVTCNPEWPEIKAALGPNDEAYNRPDLIARMLKAKSGNKQRPGCSGDACILLFDYPAIF